VARANFTPVGATDPNNYTFPTVASGPGKITAATLTATIIGDPTKTYDGSTSATLTAANYSLSGLPSGEGFTVSHPVGTYNTMDVLTATTVTVSLGVADFTPAAGTLASNYSLPTNASGSGHITTRPATWTTNPGGKTYGDADPSPLATGNGTNFIAADGVTATYSRAAGETVLGGPYHIIATLGPAAVLSNYSITNAGNNFTINKAPLTVTANNAAMVLHASLPTFTASYSGFKFSDTFASAVTGSPSLTTTATSSSPVGSYPIVAALGSLAANNYSFVFVNGILTIQYAAVGVCAGDVGHAIRQPINPDNSSVFKQKSTVPAKFAVCDANGNSIGIPGVVSGFRLIQTMSGTVVTSVDEAVDSTTPDTAFRWDPTGQQWIFNMNTKALSANTTYVYLITLNDGSSIQFMFGLK
jgi:hypothetical protein